MKTPLSPCAGRAGASAPFKSTLVWGETPFAGFYASIIVFAIKAMTGWLKKGVPFLAAASWIRLSRKSESCLKNIRTLPVKGFLNSSRMPAMGAASASCKTACEYYSHGLKSNPWCVLRQNRGGGQAQMDWSPYMIRFLRTGKQHVLCFSYILGFL